jgi:four helix bundle protein
MSSYKDWMAYKKSYVLAMKIFQITKRYPVEERFSLTDQIRRSSRSVCANLAESYKRRRYESYFISKLNDSETECGETQVWLDFSLDCGYLAAEEHGELSRLNEEVSKLLWYMVQHPKKFI